MALGFVLQAMFAPQVSAGILGDVISGIVQEEEPQAEADSKSADGNEAVPDESSTSDEDSGDGLLSLDLPSLKIDTPVAEVETPKAQVSGDGLIPSVEVTTPSVQIETPVASIDLPKVNTEISTDDSSILQIEGEDDDSDLLIDTPIVDVDIDMETTALPNIPDSVEDLPSLAPTAEPTLVPETSSPIATVTITVPKATPTTDDVGIATTSPTEETSESLTAEPTAASKEEPTALPTVDVTVRLAPESPKSPSKPDTKPTEQVKQGKEHTSSQSGPNKDQDNQLKVTAIVVNTNSGGNQSSQVGAGAQGAAWNMQPVVTGIFQSEKLNRTSVRLAENYSLGLDQWCQPPPERPPQTSSSHSTKIDH